MLAALALAFASLVHAPPGATVHSPPEEVQCGLLYELPSKCTGTIVQGVRWMPACPAAWCVVHDLWFVMYAACCLLNAAWYVVCCMHGCMLYVQGTSSPAPDSSTASAATTSAFQPTRSRQPRRPAFHVLQTRSATSSVPQTGARASARKVRSTSHLPLRSCIWVFGNYCHRYVCAGYYSRDDRPGEVRYLPTFIYTTPVLLCCRLMISAGSAGVHAMYSSTSISPFSPSDLGASHAPTSLKAGPFVQVLVASRARVVGLNRRVPTVELPLARWLCELDDSCHCRPV
jgi:hypothetical protein